MSNYQPHWDLSTTPDPEFRSEHGRRNRAKAPAATNVKLGPGGRCGKLLNATERRKPCPNCLFKHKRVSVVAALLLLLLLAVPARAQVAPGEVWKQVPQTDIYVLMNAFGGTAGTGGLPKGSGFHTYMITDMPESDIVGAPQSMMTEIEGICGTRVFHIAGFMLYSGKHGSRGLPLGDFPQEQFERKVTPDSPFERAFNMLCEVSK
jgi:hypothetical protein